jgi:hypothetical protein
VRVGKTEEVPDSEHPTEGSDDPQAALFESRLAAQEEMHPGYRDAWLAFEEAVIKHGGWRVVPPIKPDPLIGLLVEEGSLVEGSSAQLVAGDLSDCHVNAARLWRSARCDGIGTGYALSEDGLWREHSWGASNGRVVETTTPRILYFGVLMSDERAAWFADWIDPVS